MSDLRADFEGVDLWIFDLDNTLYPRPETLWARFDQRMTAFVSDALEVDLAEAHRVQKDYLVRYGTTLKGLIEHHDVEPRAFLDDVHDVALTEIEPNPALADAIYALPGRKIIHTNAVRSHAERVLARLDIPESHFGAIYDIEFTKYESKPHPHAYDIVMGAEDRDPARAAFFEDSARNLLEPHKRGMRTIFVPTDCALASDGSEGAHIHFTAHDLTSFLHELREEVRA